jgi:hypothetical protein
LGRLLKTAHCTISPSAEADDASQSSLRVSGASCVQRRGGVPSLTGFLIMVLIVVVLWAGSVFMKRINKP